MRRTLIRGAAATVAAAFIASASSVTAGAIIEGESASQQYPFAASMWIERASGQRFHCAGSLIDAGWVETNAHCLATKNDPITADKVQLRIGSNDRLTGGTVVGVQQIVVNPAWDDATADGDIILLKLAHPVPYRPVHIAHQPVHPGDAVRVIGWGCTTLPTSCTAASLPTGLRQLDTTVATRDACTAGLLHTRETCTAPGESGAEACAGDSGGAVLVEHDGEWQLVGSVSRSGATLPADTGNCQGEPMVSTDVTKYRWWTLLTIWSGGPR